MHTIENIVSMVHCSILRFKSSKYTAFSMNQSIVISKSNKDARHIYFASSWPRLPTQVRDAWLRRLHLPQEQLGFNLDRGVKSSGEEHGGHCSHTHL